MGKSGIQDAWRLVWRRLRSAVLPLHLQVTNQTRGTLLAGDVLVARQASSRRKGLLGRADLGPGEGLWIVPCEAVHTFFMRFPIDLVYLDRKHRVRKLRAAVPANRLSACFFAHSVLELAAGSIHASRTQVGDLIELLPAPADRDNLSKSA
jgi:uncharacterized membrane protein (UPF0127 family)